MDFATLSTGPRLGDRFDLDAVPETAQVPPFKYVDVLNRQYLRR